MYFKHLMSTSINDVYLVIIFITMTFSLLYDLKVYGVNKSAIDI